MKAKSKPNVLVITKKSEIHLHDRKFDLTIVLPGDDKDDLIFSDGNITCYWTKEELNAVIRILQAAKEERDHQ